MSDLIGGAFEELSEDSFIGSLDFRGELYGPSSALSCAISWPFAVGLCIRL